VLVYGDGDDSLQKFNPTAKRGDVQQFANCLSELAMMFGLFPFCVKSKEGQHRKASFLEVAPQPVVFCAHIPKVVFGES
jgi:hypothetical protein